MAYKLATEDGEHSLMLEHTSNSYKLDDVVDAFVYTNAQGELVASDIQPIIYSEQFKPLTVVGKHEFGFFFDWGLPDNLYAPQKQVHKELDVGTQYVVRLFVDAKGKLLATTKIERYLQDQCPRSMQHKAVDILLYSQTPLGYKAIVNNKYQGLLFKSDLIGKVNVGDSLSGFVKKVRDDGKLDLSLQLQTQQSRDTLQQAILDDLAAHDGISSLTDKSSPEDIYARFKVSKGAYKKALGALFKAQNITINPEYIALKQSTDKE